MFSASKVLATLSLALALSLPSLGGIVISEIHYHPVEDPEFNTNGTPKLNLYEDIHEFVEIHNPTAETIELGGWTLEGAVQFQFPGRTFLPSRGYLVVARNPDSLAALPAYGLNRTEIQGPYQGLLGNNQDTLRLLDPSGKVIESVSYSASSPWPIAADAMGAGPDYTGLNHTNYQYRGRSLERVSMTHSPNDPANWVASPIGGNPSPGKANSVQRIVPLPIVLAYRAAPSTDANAIIRSNDSVRISTHWSAADGFTRPRVEWFVENLDSTNKPVTLTDMSAVGLRENALFEAILPPQKDRTVVRYRIRAERENLDAVVSPRPDDPFQWHAYFVSPRRTSNNPAYDVFISARSLTRMDQYISQTPKRVTLPDPPGLPRDSWNATEPALFVHEGIVYEARIRYHGSRYNRSSGRQSYKLQFPRYKTFRGYQGVFETDKNEAFANGHSLFQAIGLPTSKTRFVDFYLNKSTTALRRLEQEEMDDRLLERFYAERERKYPGMFAPELPGEFYKSTGVIEGAGSNSQGEGPYGVGDERRLGAFSIWRPVDRYFWTYTIQSAEWKGGNEVMQMIEGLWNARGDTHTKPAPNIPALRAYLEANFDIDKTLTYLATINWMGPWDDTTQNHFVWRQRNSKWAMAPWDFDSMFGSGDNAPSSASIFMGEYKDPNNNFRGPNWLKDSFFKAFREEYKEKMFILNNTVLSPANLRSLGPEFSTSASYASARFTAVNTQLKFGPFTRPATPVALSPAQGQSIGQGWNLVSSPYSHTTNPAPAHSTTTWTIRTLDGTYDAPVFYLTTSNQLTSLPIPPGRLTPGKVYFWRCLHTDARQHHSAWSEETSFSLGAPVLHSTLLDYSTNTLWRYYDATNAPEGFEGAWKQVEFDDSTWRSGPALLGAETNKLIEPLRTPLTLGSPTYYFRTAFSFDGDPATARLKLNYVIDDGLVIYLNGTELWRTGVATGVLRHTNYASRSITRATNEGPFNLPAISLQTGTNVLAVEVHTFRNSRAVAFGLKLEVDHQPLSDDVILSEIAAINSGSVVVGGESPDWIELFNRSSQVIDLTGSALTTDPGLIPQFIFPPNTRMDPQTRLIVWCDSQSQLPGLHAGFSLKGGGDTVVLLAPSTNGWLVRDLAQFGNQAPDYTLSRFIEGKSSRWQLGLPTPDAPNQAAETIDPVSAGIRINEWLSTPLQGQDPWIELFNPSDKPTSIRELILQDPFAATPSLPLGGLTFLGAHAHLQLRADGNRDRGNDHVDEIVHPSGGHIQLIHSATRQSLDAVRYAAQNENQAEGRMPDGDSRITSFPQGGTPGAPNELPIPDLVITEILGAGSNPFEDAIELHYRGPGTLDLSGWFVSDDASDWKKFRIPEGTRVGPGGYVVFYGNQLDGPGNNPGDFGLSASRREEVVVSATDPSGFFTGYRIHGTTGPAERNVSFGRSEDWDGPHYVWMSRPTFGVDQPSSVRQFRTGTGAPNAAPLVGPLIISEIQHQGPPPTNNTPTSGFIELYNPNDTSVVLYDPARPNSTWRLASSDSTFHFPENLQLEPRNVLLVVPFDPAATDLSAWKKSRGIPDSIQVFGPFHWTSSPTEAQINLERPLPSSAPGTAWITVDSIHYLTHAPWPGQSTSTTDSSTLHRWNRSYGNNPNHWLLQTPSPGEPPASDSDSDGIPNAWELTHQLDPNDPNDALADADGDGQSNRDEYFAGTNPNDPNDVLRLSLEDSEGGLILSFEAQAGRGYEVEFRTLADEGAWQSFGIIPISRTPRTIRLQDQPTDLQRLYRLRVVRLP